jgi:hypothetical protein
LFAPVAVVLHILLDWWHTPLRSLSFRFFTILMLFVWWCCGGGVSIEVVVVALCGGSWDCLGEVWMRSCGFFGLRFGVRMVCGQDLHKGVADVV